MVCVIELQKNVSLFQYSRIGKARGYKAGELSKFTEGQTLLIGGKEIEVQ